MPSEIKKISELVSSYREAKVLFTAASMDIFSLTAGKYAGLEKICSLKNLDKRAARILLDALVSAGFLKKRQDKYLNSALADKFLVVGGKEYVGNNLRYQNIIWEAWSGLDKVIKTGRPAESLMDLLANRKDFTEGYIRGMADIARKPAAELADRTETGKISEMLDVGGGPGTYTEAFLKKNPAMTGTILDLPQTLGITRKIFSSSPLKKRVRLMEGNYHKADFGKDKYDLILLSHVTHDEGPAAVGKMLKKAYRALRRGGRVIIHDFMLDPDLTSPRFSALFSVHMLVYTNKGQVYSEKEYAGMLRKAGFKNIKSADICKNMENRSRAVFGGKT
ncbi:MAG: methyltransferase [Elusimicrobia bacterium]|nr:methyltransferase [Elusimicrobiota bacterium]